MPKSKKISISALVLIAVLGGGALWVVLTALLLAQPVAASLLFIVWQLAGVAAPGLLIVKLFRPNLTPLEALVTGYALGVGLNVGVWFGFALFHEMRPIPWVIGTIAVLSLAGHALLRKRPLAVHSDQGELRIALALCAFAAAAVLIVFSAANLAPDISGTRIYYGDTLFGVALTTSANWGYPLTTLQMAGTPEYYYIFPFALGAIFKLMSGQSSLSIVTGFLPVTYAAFAAAAGVMLCKRVLRGKWPTILAVVLLFVIPSSAGAYFLYQDSIGYALGMGLGLLSVHFFFRAEARGSRLYNGDYALSVLFLLFCLMAKGPFALVTLFCICFSLLLSLIRNRRWNVFLQGGCYALPFLAIYVLLFRDAASGAMQFEPLYSALLTAPALALQGILPVWICAIIGTLYYCFSFDPVLLLTLIVSVIYYARRGKEVHPLVDFAFGGVLFGFVFINLFKHAHSSETYMLIAALPFTTLSALYCLQALRAANPAGRPRRGYVVLSAILAPCIALNAVVAGRCYWGAVGSTDTGLSQTLTHSRFAPGVATAEEIDALDARSRSLAVTPQEYEAYLWLRDNTPLDAVIADGRYLCNDKFFAGSALSERGFFLDGYNFVTVGDTNDRTPEKVRRDTFLRFFFESGDEAYLPLMAREGCSYILISQYANPGLYLSDRHCALVFQNDDVAVYELYPYNPGH